jgi:hypothetical protein
MPEIPLTAWTEFCFQCGSIQPGSTPVDGCYWECHGCNRHYEQAELRDNEDIPFEGEPDEAQADPQTNTPGWHSELTLPAGFAWMSLPGVLTSVASVGINTLDQNYPERMHEFRGWLEANELHAQITDIRDSWIGGVYVRRPRTIHIAPGDVPLLAGPSQPFDLDFECPICAQTHIAYTVMCTSQGQELFCASCQFGRDHRTLVRAGDQLLCTQCTHPCSAPECDTNTGAGREYCDEHGQYATCGFCGSELEAPADDEREWASGGGFEVLCENCSALVCPECDRVDHGTRTYFHEVDEHVCQRCFQVLVYGPNEESFDEEALLNARKLRIPTIPGRENVRTCGVEIEGANGTGDADTLASAFCEDGLNEYDEVMGYHSGSTGGFAHVERDSSVDWEAVIGPFNPAVQSDVTRLNRAVETIRGMVHDGTLGLDLRAGLHIHVGAERVSLDGAYNLNVLFSYLEDVIFRLGAARWPVHRAVMDTHYTQPIPKELRKLEFAQRHGDEGSRYYALSFNNYFRSMLRRCECGAVRYDSWEDCTCHLGKCTFEFRVFNTTANPRKLHAYLALTQALVSKALSMGKVVDPVVHFPVLSFEPSRFKDMDEVQQSVIRVAWKERLDWMFSELPLTDDEKQSLIYCIRHSELEVIGDGNISELFPMEEVAEEVTA